MSKLGGAILEVAQTGEEQCREMYQLFSGYFPGVTFPEFMADFTEKKWVIVLTEKEHGTIQGFSTQTVIETQVGDRTCYALFSGDTIIAREFWGEKILMAIWGRLAFDLIDQYQGRDLYWFLLCLGYKTYRFLPVFFKEFYPAVDQPDQPQLQQVLDSFARDKYGTLYDAEKGVVRMGKGAALRRGVADIDERLRRNPHIDFFVRKNPGFSQGDELACIAPLCLNNFNRFAHRIVQRGA
jgi:hypothetical protein